MLQTFESFAHRFLVATSQRRHMGKEREMGGSCKYLKAVGYWWSRRVEPLASALRISRSAKM
jgi:hypothetical protein